MSSFVFVLLCLIVVSFVQGFSDFANNIPNGHNLPHPYAPNAKWRGVGHLNPNGRGALNPFGEDFRQANFQWTPELCRKDSDNDGLTNGAELGDPTCVWTRGRRLRATRVTHPGFANRRTAG